jgi:hypothetical protein
MTLGFVLTGVVALLSIGWVVAPLLHRDAARSEDLERVNLSDLRELHARQQMLLASLRDLEDDRATEKLDDADYETLKARLSNETIDVMKQLDEAESERQQAVEQLEAAGRPLRYKPREEPEGDPT